MPTPSPESSTAPALPCASSSWTGPVVPLTARPTGDVLTRPRPAAAVAALLGLMAVRFLMPRLAPGFPRAQDLAKVSRPRAPRCLPARSVLTRALKFPL